MDNKNQKKYFPILVDDADFEIFQKVNALPQKTQEILKSEGVVNFIYGAEQRFRLEDEQTKEFSRLVRKYFFREVSENVFAKQVAKLCKTSPDEALKLLHTIQTIDPEKAVQEEQMKNVVKMSLNKAIAQYPSVLDQLITKKSIITKPFLKPLKPTVKNWIMVYEKLLDVSKHNAIERGEFIFQSEATKNISDEEKRNLSLVLKSRDEDSELMIDAEKGQIVFSIKKQKPAQLAQKNSAQTNIHKNAENKKVQQPVQHFSHAQNMQKVTSPVTQKKTVQKKAEENSQLVSQNTFIDRTNLVEETKKKPIAPEQSKSFDMTRSNTSASAVQNQKNIQNTLLEKEDKNISDSFGANNISKKENTLQKSESSAQFFDEQVSGDKEDVSIKQGEGFFGTSTYLSRGITGKKQSNDDVLKEKKQIVGSAVDARENTVTVAKGAQEKKDESREMYTKKVQNVNVLQSTSENKKIVAEEKSVDVDESGFNIQNSKEKNIAKDDILQNAAGEIEYFAKNVVKRSSTQNGDNVIIDENKPVEISVDEQDVIDREMGKKKTKRKIGTARKKNKKDDEIKASFPTTSGKVLIDKEGVDEKIAKEEEELRRATEKMNKLISEMQENVTIPRNIGEGVVEKKRVSLQKEHGDMEEEIKKNRKELYGETYEEEPLLELEKELHEAHNVEDKKISKTNKFKKQEKIKEKKKEKSADNVINEKNIFEEEVVLKEEKKKKEKTDSIVFSSNHLLPSEKEKEDVQNRAKNSFNITPIGRAHISEEIKDESE